MKSHWFHLMPYKYLPEDFAQNTRAYGWMCPVNCTIPSKATNSTTSILTN